MIWQNLKWSKLNIKAIIKGWYTKLIKKRLNSIPYYIVQQSVIRKSHCDNCPLNTKGWCDTSKEEKDINGILVNGCGCELEAKQLTEDQECPRLLWKVMLNENDWNNYIIKINEYYIDNNKEELIPNENDLIIINALLNGE